MGGSKKKEPIEANPIYQQGRTARLGGISRDQAPYGDGDDLELWLKGWDDDSDPNGSIARDRTMNPEPQEASGQVATTSAPKKG